MALSCETREVAGGIPTALFPEPPPPSEVACVCLAESIQVRVLGACTCHQAYTRSSFDVGHVGDRAAFVRDLTWAAVEAWWRGGLVVE